MAVGLDIGTTKIVAMIGKKNEYGKLEFWESVNLKV
jgi:cell division protein FtsA